MPPIIRVRTKSITTKNFLFFALTCKIIFIIYKILIIIFILQAQLNVEEFSKLLTARGPYLEWHNKHPELDRHISEDIFRNGADTIVDVKEFSDIVNRALELYHKNSLNS